MVWRVVPGQHSATARASHTRLPGGLGEGWLCFETADEKRRLTPVPDAWEAAADDGLWALCETAVPVRRPAGAG
jgi:hypothetical protein